MRTLPSRILAIADEETLGPDLVDRAAAAVRGGLHWICLRARRADTQERVRLGQELLQACPGLFLTVHGDREAAEVLGAPGLHLPSRGPHLAAPRGDGGTREVLWGMSCPSREELAAAEQAGADYALLSPFRAPLSKVAGGAVIMQAPPVP